MTNAQILRDARVALSISLRQLSELTLIPVVRVGEIERGVGKAATPEELVLLFQALTAVVAKGRKRPNERAELTTEQTAEHAYEVYCDAFMKQKTLRPTGPGKLPLAAWAAQREEIRDCWRAVARFFKGERQKCNRFIEIETPQGVMKTRCALPEGHEVRAAIRGELSPCGAFFAVAPDDSTIR